MTELLPGTEVLLCGLRWRRVTNRYLGAQKLHRILGLEGAFVGQES
jgi:hypothetical protein